PDPKALPLPHPQVEGEGLGFAHRDLLEFRVRGVQQVVRLLRDDRGGDREDRRLSLPRPARPELGEGFGRRVLSPGTGEAGDLDRRDLQRVGNLRRDDDQVGRSDSRGEVDEVLQDRERQGRGGVNDRGPSPVPAAPGEPRALAVEGRVPLTAEPPHSHDCEVLGVRWWVVGGGAPVPSLYLPPITY